MTWPNPPRYERPIYPGDYDPPAEPDEDYHVWLYYDIFVDDKDAAIRLANELCSEYGWEWADGPEEVDRAGQKVWRVVLSCETGVTSDTPDKDVLRRLAHENLERDLYRAADEVLPADVWYEWEYGEIFREWD